MISDLLLKKKQTNDLDSIVENAKSIYGTQHFLVDYENVNEAGLEGIGQLSEKDYVYIFYSEQIKSIPFERSIELRNSKAHIEFIQMHKVKKNYLDFQLSSYIGYLIAKDENASFIIVSKDTGFESVVDLWIQKGVLITRRQTIEVKPIKVEEEKKPEVKRKTLAERTGKGKKNIKSSKPKNTVKNEKNVKQEKVEEKDVPEKKKRSDVNASDDVNATEKKQLPDSVKAKVREAVKDDKLSPGNYAVIYKAILESETKLDLNNTLVKALKSAKGGEVYGHVKNIYAEYKKN